MARNYTLEDIESLRAKAALSYEDAVALLDKYNGDLARALIELEKKGLLSSFSKGAKVDVDDVVERIQALWYKGLNTRIIVEHKGVQLTNLAVTFIAVMALLGIYAVICGLIIALISGCSITLKKVITDEQLAEEIVSVKRAPTPEEAPSEDTQTEEEQAEETQSEEAPTEDAPSEEAPTEEEPAEDTSYPTITIF